VTKPFDSEQQPELGQDFSPGKYFARKSLHPPSLFAGLNGAPLTPRQPASTPPRHSPGGGGAAAFAGRMSDAHAIALSTVPGLAVMRRIAVHNTQALQAHLVVDVTPKVAGFTARLVPWRLRPGERGELVFEYRPATEFDGQCIVTVRGPHVAQLAVRLSCAKAASKLLHVQASLRAVDFGIVDALAGATADFLVRNSSPWAATLKLSVERESHSSCFSVEGPTLLEAGASARVLVDFLPRAGVRARYSCAVVITAYFPHATRRWSLPCRAEVE